MDEKLTVAMENENHIPFLVRAYDPMVTNNPLNIIGSVEYKQRYPYEHGSLPPRIVFAKDQMDAHKKYYEKIYDDLYKSGLYENMTKEQMVKKLNIIYGISTTYPLEEIMLNIIY